MLQHCNQSAISTIIVGIDFYKFMKKIDLQFNQLGPKKKMKQFEQSVPIHPTIIVPKEPCQNFTYQLALSRIQLYQTLLLHIFLKQLLIESNPILIINATLFIFVANCSIKFQLTLYIQFMLYEQLLLKIPSLLVLTIHHQQYLCNPVIFDLFTFLSSTQLLHKINIVQFEKLMAYTQAVLLQSYYLGEEFVRHMLDL